MTGISDIQTNTSIDNEGDETCTFRFFAHRCRWSISASLIRTSQQHLSAIGSRGVTLLCQLGFRRRKSLLLSGKPYMVNGGVNEMANYGVNYDESARESGKVGTADFDTHNFEKLPGTLRRYPAYLFHFLNNLLNSSTLMLAVRRIERKVPRSSS
jgi:hypothetical protein